MAESKDTAQLILSRMRQAYDVTSNVDLAERIKTPKSTVSNWVSRDSVPFRYIMLCSQDTGADLDWLLKGEFANASFEAADSVPVHSGESIYNTLLESGGQSVLHRLMLAYGFKMQKQLGELLGISSGTMSTWVRRNHFPGEAVVACALDTGVDLCWLATGKGEMSKPADKGKGRLIDHLELFAGKMTEKGEVLIDSSIIPPSASYPIYLTSSKMAWLIDTDRREVASGTLLLNVDGELDIYTVAKIPGNKITVCNVNDGVDFTCSTDDVTSEGRVMLTVTASS